MLPMNDFLTDESDDIIIKDDILHDEDGSVSVMNTVERRVVARWDDFVFDDIAAGIERFIFQTQTFATIENIRSAINKVLLANRLLDASDFRIKIPEPNSRTLSVFLEFRNVYLIDQPEFKIIVDIENQRVYRG